jgi:hypothetical protein
MNVKKTIKTVEADETSTTFPNPHPSAAPINTGDCYIAYCGIDCSRCPQYQTSCPEGCLGITSVDYCGQCEVRKCSMDRQSVNCGFCGEYPCQKLEKQYESMVNGGYSSWAATAKAVLEEIRSGNKIEN